jgi:hypothetical protein
MSKSMPIVNISCLFDRLRPTDEATSHRPKTEMQKKIQEKKTKTRANIKVSVPIQSHM